MINSLTTKPLRYSFPLALSLKVRKLPRVARSWMSLPVSDVAFSETATSPPLTRIERQGTASVTMETAERRQAVCSADRGRLDLLHTVVSLLQFFLR